MTFRVSRRAHADIAGIWDYIAKDDPIAADRVDREIHEAIQGLAAMPGKGHLRPDVADAQYRFWSVYSYVIVYRMEGRTLVVVRIVHGARDLKKFFKRRR